ncbi:MAG: GHKL domain-containing protein [Coriobacteriia bacterium]|nr:GHKL domain-containing protein [Coriobacteriia bacterium]
MREGLRETLSRIARITYALIIIFLIALLAGQVLSGKNNIIYYYSELHVLSVFEHSVNGKDMGKIELPAVIDNLKPGDTVTLRGTVESRMLDNVLIDAEHTYLKFYVNNRLYYEIGGAGTFPSFQKEPPHVVTSIALPSAPEYLDLRFDYTVPSTGSSLTLQEIYLGDNDLLFSMLVDFNLVLLLLSSFILIGAIVFVIIGLVLIRRAAVASAFIWLGLTCLATSIWAFCSNAIVLYLIPQPALFYNFGYVGLFGIIPAFLRFNSSILTSKRNWLIRGLVYSTAVGYAMLLVTHLIGIFSFIEFSPIMFYAGPVLILAFAIAVVIEHFRFKNRIRPRFVISCSILVLFTLLEFYNEAWSHFLPAGLFFQVGLAFFVIELAVLAWQYVSEALDASEKNAQLQFEIISTNRALSAQRALYETLATSNEEMRKLRHDMRHQLSAIRGYLEEDHNEEALEYLDTLYGSIPNMADLFICDNFAINALAAHYHAIAKERGIQVDMRLVVPEKLGRIVDNDLSIIIGNLFENAIEACGYVDAHKRFIKMQSSVDKQRFTLVIDNSYDGHLDVRRGDFYSRKRPGKGIGMASVRSEVHKYEGSMKYETVDGVFKTSLYIKL